MRDRIDEEQVCIDCFVTSMRERDSETAVTYERECHDPPDFWMMTAGQKFAVEVTSITDREAVRHYSHCNQLAKTIMAQAKQAGILSGGYTLAVHRQPSIPRLRSDAGRDIQRRALAYVRRTASDERAEPHELIRDQRDRVVIEKVTPDGAFVGLLGPILDLIAGQRIVADMAKLMQMAIVRKRERLLTKDQDILKHCTGAVLLLYDAYGPSEVKHARAAFEKRRDYDWFHTIFVASPIWREMGMPMDETGRRREDHILFTKESAWLETDGIRA